LANYEVTQEVVKSAFEARGVIKKRQLLGLVGLKLAFGVKTEADPSTPEGMRVTQLVTSASAIAEALKKRAGEKVMNGASGEADLVEAEWWSGYGQGAYDSSTGAFKYTIDGVKDFAQKQLEKKDRLKAAYYRGYAASMLKQPGENVPAGGEFIIPITAAQPIDVAAAA
jgi:hypothetical protein